MSNLSRSFSKHLSSVMTGFGGLAKIDVIQTQETLSLDRGEEVGKETCVLTFLRIIWPLAHHRGKYRVKHGGHSPALIYLPWRATLVKNLKQHKTIIGASHSKLSINPHLFCRLIHIILTQENHAL